MDWERYEECPNNEARGKSPLGQVGTWAADLDNISTINELIEFLQEIKTMTGEENLRLIGIHSGTQSITVDVLEESK